MGSTFNEDAPIGLLNNASGEVLEIQGVSIQLPKVPALETIAGYDKEIKDRKWKPTEQPKGLKRSNIDEYAYFIEQELHRIENGFWFFVKDVPTYITGLHYYYLTYIKIDVGFPQYRQRDRLFFYFWEASMRYKKCTGVTLVKPRRMGATWIGSAILLYYGTRVRDALLGILSKTGADAKSMFSKKVVSAFKKLPFWLQPTSASGTNPKTSLEFTETTRRGKSTEQGVEESEALNTVIEWRTTTENSFDSEKLYVLFADEFGKLEKDISLETLWEVVSKTLYVGLRVVGRVFMPSTVNDLDAGGAQFQNLFLASRISKMQHGQTPTGMWAYFVPAYEGLEGFIDEYGDSVTEDPKEPTFDEDGTQIELGSKTALMRVREAKKEIGKKAYLENIRQFPFTVEEAFYFNAETALLDTERIAQQISYNENVMIEKPIKRGNFVWEIKHKKAIWVPNESNGRFSVTWLPPADMQNAWFIKNGSQRPSNTMYGAFGLDPYEVNITVDKRGSNQGFHGHTKRVMGGRPEVPNYKCFLEYVYRPDTVEQAFEDALMAAVFYGFEVLFENNKYSFARYAEQVGLIEYVSQRPLNTYQKDPRYHATNTKTRGYPANEDTNSTHAGMLQVYVSQNIGEDEDTGQISDFPWTETLKQLAVFNIPDRGKLDGAVSLGAALLAVNVAPVDLSVKRIESAPLIQKGKIVINR